MKLKLAHVDMMNFTSSVEANLEASLKRHRIRLGDSECAILFSMMGNQAVFLRKPTEADLNGTRNVLYVSTKLKLKEPGEGRHPKAWTDDLEEFFAQAAAFGLEVTGLRSRVIDYLASLGKVPERKIRSVG
jgi:hypothetical protein